MIGSGIARGARVLLATSIGSLLLGGCGSSGSTRSSASSTAATTSASTAATTSASTEAPTAHDVTLTLRGVRGKRASITSLARLPKGRREAVRARLSGLAGQTLSQKLQTLASTTASFWGQEFQASHLQLPAATINIVGDTPVSCGSSQILTGSPPSYCVPTLSLELTLSYFQNSIEPIGDAATALLVSDLYGYHVENALHLLGSSSLTPAQLTTTDSCLSGVFFYYLMAQNELGAGDEQAVNTLIAQLVGASSNNGSSGVTAQQLSTSFNQGILSQGNAGVCLPKSSSS